MTNKCHDKDCSHNSFDIASEVENSKGDQLHNCKIHPNITSTQYVDLVWYQTDTVHIDVSVKSHNGHVEYINTNRNSCKKAKKLPPSSVGNTVDVSLPFKLKQSSTNNTDTLEATISYFDDEDADESEKNTTVPNVYPDVDLS